MPLYEHIYLARQDVSPQQVEEMTTNLTNVLTQGGGKVTKNEYWGLKSLSYRIKKNRKAHYTLLNIDAPHSAVAEMERQQGLSEDILRFMTIRVDELEEGPSAMMQKRDRDDDRGERGSARRDPALRSRPGRLGRERDLHDGAGALLPPVGVDRGRHASRAFGVVRVPFGDLRSHDRGALRG